VTKNGNFSCEMLQKNTNTVSRVAFSSQHAFKPHSKHVQSNELPRTIPD